MAHGDLSIDDKKIIDEETSILENIFLAIDEEKKKQQNFKKTLRTDSSALEKRLRVLVRKIYLHFSIR